MHLPALRSVFWECIQTPTIQDCTVHFKQKGKKLKCSEHDRSCIKSMTASWCIQGWIFLLISFSSLSSPTSLHSRPTTADCKPAGMTVWERDDALLLCDTINSESWKRILPPVHSNWHSSTEVMQLCEWLAHTPPLLLPPWKPSPNKFPYRHTVESPIK